MAITYIAAVDIGASSGRVILASFCDQTYAIKLAEMARFPNQFISIKTATATHDCWQIDQLVENIKLGLEKTVQHLHTSHQASLSSIAIDTWGVDYVLLDKNGDKLGLAYAYRDARTFGVMEGMIDENAAEAYSNKSNKLDQSNKLTKLDIYEKTGIQFLSFNTLYQLKAFIDEAKLKGNDSYLAQIAHLLLIPDYLSYKLTNCLNYEYTNATTTQLLNVKTDDWDMDLLANIGVPAHWLTKPTLPGNEIGKWQAHGIPVHACASHDTASAVLAAPLLNERSAYLSSGTWSLMGIENDAAITDDQALKYNLTNEGGYQRRFRILKNIMGLWIFQQYCKESKLDDITALIKVATVCIPFKFLINPNDDCFLNPTSMKTAILEFCQKTGQESPSTDGEFARLIFDSLALSYRQSFLELCEITQKNKGYILEQIQIVGGGSQNILLNQLCADTCNVPVLAGPVEASALGNIGSQLISLNKVNDLHQYRQLIAQNFKPQLYSPQVIPNFKDVILRFRALFQ